MVSSRWCAYRKLPLVFACVTNYPKKKVQRFLYYFAQLKPPAVPTTYVPHKPLYRCTVRSSTTERSARNPSSSSSYAFSPSPKGGRGREGGDKFCSWLRGSPPPTPSSLSLSTFSPPPPCNPVRLTRLGRKRKEGLLSLSLSFSRGRRGGTERRSTVSLARATDRRGGFCAVIQKIKQKR